MVSSISQIGFQCPILIISSLAPRKVILTVSPVFIFFWAVHLFPVDQFSLPSYVYVSDRCIIVLSVFFEIPADAAAHQGLSVDKIDIIHTSMNQIERNV